MALKTCKECSKQYSDTLEACPHCGYVDSSKVTIYGYTETFAISPDVKIYKDGVLIGKVGANSKIDITISQPCRLKFSCSMRSDECYVKPGDNVVLAFNRVTGGLSASVTNKDNVMCEINEKKSKDSKRWIWIIIFVAICLAVGYFMKQHAQEMIYEDVYYY